MMQSGATMETRGNQSKDWIRTTYRQLHGGKEPSAEEVQAAYNNYSKPKQTHTGGFPARRPARFLLQKQVVDKSEHNPG